MLCVPPPTLVLRRFAASGQRAALPVCPGGSLSPREGSGGFMKSAYIRRYIVKLNAMKKASRCCLSSCEANKYVSCEWLLDLGSNQGPTD